MNFFEDEIKMDDLFIAADEYDRTEGSREDWERGNFGCSKMCPNCPGIGGCN
jgi:hypothetical protein